MNPHTPEGMDRARAVDLHHIYDSATNSWSQGRPMPVTGMRRADIIIIWGQVYLDEGRYDECIELMESAPYFVNWEGSSITWDIFNEAHMKRGKQRLKKKILQRRCRISARR